MGYCFVLMPFSSEMNEIFDTIRDSVEGEPCNFRCQRADELVAGGYIVEDVLRGIGEAELVVADLTGRNANVFYELGIAHMVKRPSEIVLLTQDIAALPFDLQSFRCIQYRQTIQGGKKLKDDLRRSFSAMAHPVHKFEVPHGGKFQFPTPLLGEENCFYDFLVSADCLGKSESKLMLQVRRFAADIRVRDQVYDGVHAIPKDSYLKVPKIPWELTLDRVIGNSAQFRLVRHSEANGDGSDRTPLGSKRVGDMTLAELQPALAEVLALREAGLK
jgi:hypothetical protein